MLELQMLEGILMDNEQVLYSRINENGSFQFMLQFHRNNRTNYIIRFRVAEQEGSIQIEYQPARGIIEEKALCSFIERLKYLIQMQKSLRFRFVTGACRFAPVHRGTFPMKPEEYFATYLNIFRK